jgi:hypothetical protein
MFGAVTTGRDIPPEQPLEELFTFIDAFEHFQIPDEDVFIPIGNPKVREKLFTDGRYGWVALAPESKMGSLIEKMGWPDHPFCSVFDLQIIPLQGDFEKYAGIDPEEAWRQRGLDIYEHQTPASWKK